VRDLRRLVGGPSALFAFESAARLGSFTRAAEELCVSQAAVSISIKGLEKSLGATLFRRDHKKVVLTPQGEIFFRDVAMGLGHIQRSAAALKAQPRGQQVTLSCSTAFASHWVIPRLGDFRSRHPTIDLRIHTSDRDVETLENPAAMAILRGPRDFAPPDRARAWAIADEVIFPVCSPTFHERELQSKGPDGWARARLIHLEEPYRPRPTWRDWFAYHRVAYPEETETLRLNDYSLVVQAAIGSQGVAIGWEHTVAYSLHVGLLMRPSALEWRTSKRFYVITHAEMKEDSDAAIVRDWFLSESNRADADRRFNGSTASSAAGSGAPVIGQRLEA
jgi:DNA-binding transcriptional LysR family regulator